MASTIRLSDAAIRPGDLLVHHARRPDGHPVSVLASAIAEIGRCEDGAYHVAMADLLPGGVIVAIEMVPPEGRQEELSIRVNKLPGVVHWLQVPDRVKIGSGDDAALRCYDRLTAVLKMREYIGVKYGFATIGRDYLAASWGRWFRDLPADNEAVDWQPVCSVAALDALQTGFGGWDMVVDLNTACAQPEDVNRICVLTDMGALVP